MIGLEWIHHSFEFPQTSTPEWSTKVERWYQLDAAAFALTETFWRHRDTLKSRPETMFLASPLASNHTDAQFASSQAPSPAKFVHTLPNIRGASLLQVMEWSGQVYCLQKDPETVLAAISEGMQTVKSSGREAWILSVTEAGGKFTGHILRLVPDATGCALKIVENDSQNMANAALHDKGLFLWLKGESART
ncbi:MAG: hypothetical protein ACXVA9_07765, partial [Bdellovibrionales bacterium]